MPYACSFFVLHRAGNSPFSSAIAFATAIATEDAGEPCALEKGVRGMFFVTTQVSLSMRHQCGIVFVTSITKKKAVVPNTVKHSAARNRNRNPGEEPGNKNGVAYSYSIFYLYVY